MRLTVQKKTVNEDTVGDEQYNLNTVDLNITLETCMNCVHYIKLFTKQSLAFSYNVCALVYVG